MTYQKRKQAIARLFFEMQKNDEVICDYIEAYHEMYGFDVKNNNNEYRTNTNLAGLITEMKTLKDHVGTVMNKVDVFNAQLMQIIAVLERNLERNMEEERFHSSTFYGNGTDNT